MVDLTETQKTVIRRLAWLSNRIPRNLRQACEADFTYFLERDGMTLSDHRYLLDQRPLAQLPPELSGRPNKNDALRYLVYVKDAYEGAFETPYLKASAAMICERIGYTAQSLENKWASRHALKTDVITSKLRGARSPLVLLWLRTTVAEIEAYERERGELPTLAAWWEGDDHNPKRVVPRVAPRRTR